MLDDSPPSFYPATSPFTCWGDWIGIGLQNKRITQNPQFLTFCIRRLRISYQGFPFFWTTMIFFRSAFFTTRMKHTVPVWLPGIPADEYYTYVSRLTREAGAPQNGDFFFLRMKLFPTFRYVPAAMVIQVQMLTATVPVSIGRRNRYSSQSNIASNSASQLLQPVSIVSSSVWGELWLFNDLCIIISTKQQTIIIRVLWFFSKM